MRFGKKKFKYVNFGLLEVLYIALGNKKIWKSTSYINFKDKNVELICAEKWGDGIGVTKKDLESVTDLDLAFTENSDITSFNELLYFTNLEGINENEFSDCSSLTSITIPEGVTSIGNYAFANCASLLSINIPDNLKNIGDSAFCSCLLLSLEITIPDTVESVGGYAFALTPIKTFTLSNKSELNYLGTHALLGTGITTINIPQNLTTLESYVLCGTQLQQLIIPETVTTISKGALQDNYNLTKLVLPPSITHTNDEGILITDIGTDVFTNCTGELEIQCNLENTTTSYFSGSNFSKITVTDLVKFIGNNSFAECKCSNYAVLGNDVTLGSSIFTNCTGKLTVNCNIPSVSSSSNGTFYGSKFSTVVIGEGVTEIGLYAFEGCNNLTAITIPESVTSIGMRAFAECTSLNLINLSNNSQLTTLLANTFRNCAITQFNIPNSVTSIGGSAFYGCSSLTSINIPDGVISIGKSAFYNCSSLQSITIPEGVTSIGESAFENCKSLTSINIPENITNIPTKTFRGCSSLHYITIPNNVTNISNLAFDGCTKLSYITCESINPPSISNSNCFNNVSKAANIIVPSSAVENYKSANVWKEFICFLDSVKSGQCGTNATYKITNDSGLIIEGTGAMYDYDPYDPTDKPWYSEEIKHVLIKEGITKIGNYSFNYLAKTITGSVVISDGVESIGDGAFGYNTGLKYVRIPKSVIEIGLSAFILTPVIEIENPYWVGDGLADGISYCDGCVIGLESTFTNLTDITIKEGTRIISDYCFFEETFDTITLPKSLTRIPNACFKNSILTTINIPEDSKLESIESRAFEDCSNLTSITIPKNVKSIGRHAFDGCSSCQRFDFSKHNSIPSLSSYAFDNTTGNIIVPSNLHTTWCNATGWKDYTGKIIKSG